MKLQINGQQVRLRIDEEELQKLSSGNALVATTVLPAGISFGWQLRLHPGMAANLASDDAGWRVELPIAAVNAYVERLPCKQGLDFALPTDSGTLLELVLEVDVRDSVRRRGAPSHRE